MRTPLVRQRLKGAARVAAAAMGISTTIVLAAPAGAQQAPATPERQDAAATGLPFRGGQWGMDFGISGGNTYRIGAVRFTSPRRAWILDGRISGSINRREILADGDTTGAGYVFDENVINQGGSASLLVGRRAYRAIGARAMRTLSFAIGGGAGYGEHLADGRRVSSGVTWNGTAEGALGGHFRVTPSLALGATLRLGATYLMSEQRASSGYRQRVQQLDVGLGTSDLVLSLFF